MQAGKLDRRIAIQTSTTTANSIGEWIPTWSTTLSLWASVDFTDSKENFEAQQLVAPNEVTFKTRYNATVTEKMRIIYAGYIYDIKHIAEINRREGLKIIALKKDNAAYVSNINALLDENGDPVLDENGNVILTET